MQIKIKDCDEEHAKTKNDLTQANQNKQQFIKKLKDEIEQQKKKNDQLQSEKDENENKIRDLRDQLSSI